jgi:hypothetical protein
MAKALKIEIKPADLEALIKFNHNLPIDAENMVKDVFLGVGKVEVKRIQAEHYSSTGGHSIGIGPGRHGHVKAALHAKAGAIAFGGYVRMKFRPGPRFKAFFAERGTFKDPERRPLATGAEGIDDAALEASLSAGLDRVLGR